MAAEAVMILRDDQGEGSQITIEVWPPQVLWDHCAPHLTREQLAFIIGAPPSDHPAGITYIGLCVQALARTRLTQDVDEVLPVPFGKIEHNGFGDEVAELIKSFQLQTDHVRHYFLKSSPGEQQQAIENLRTRYDGLRARLDNADAIFHALCDDLVEEAFKMTPPGDEEQKRNAAMMVITHFFETCQIFESPRES